MMQIQRILGEGKRRRTTTQVYIAFLMLGYVNKIENSYKASPEDSSRNDNKK